MVGQWAWTMPPLRRRMRKNAIWQKLTRLISELRSMSGRAHYHPEAHYMRGPGPKALAKSGSKASHEGP